MEQIKITGKRQKEIIRRMQNGEILYFDTTPPFQFCQYVFPIKGNETICTSFSRSTGNSLVEKGLIERKEYHNKLISYQLTELGKQIQLH